MRTRAQVAAAIVAVTVAAACGDGSATPVLLTAAASTVATTAPAASPSPAPSSPVTAPPEATGPTATATVTTLPEPVPEQAGVGGVTSGLDVCRDWARLTGSYLLLTVAAGFSGLGRPALDRLEVAAAGVVVEAAGALMERWPAELAAERDVVADGVVEPLAARARRALDALDTAGLDDPGRAELAAAWLHVLASQDRADPLVVLPPLSPGVAAAVDVAAAELARSLERVDLDPSLGRGQVATPLTDAYLLERCPEAVELVGTDAV